MYLHLYVQVYLCVRVQHACLRECPKPQAAPPLKIVGNWQDWGCLDGRLLCKECYSRFRIKGTLERARERKQQTESFERRCTYQGCERPLESKNYMRIDGVGKAGGQDWTGLVGMGLCSACYGRYRLSGRLEGKRRKVMVRDDAGGNEGVAVGGTSRPLIRGATSEGKAKVAAAFVTGRTARGVGGGWLRVWRSRMLLSRRRRSV